MSDTGGKLFLGPRLRRLRRELGLTQTRLAEELGLSPSYVNLMERNQRPLTAAVVLRLAQVYDLDLRTLTAEDDHRSATALAEVFGNPLFRDIAVPRQEIQDLTDHCPGAADAVLRLFAAYQETLKAASGAAGSAETGRGGAFQDPIERVRDLLETNRNHFPELDEAAEALADELALGEGDFFAAARARLRERHAVVTRVLPVELMPESLRRFDRHRRQLLISEVTDRAGRAFQVAYQLGAAEQSTLVEAVLDRIAEKEPVARRMLRVSLLNYFAAAVMMPYGRFQTAAEALGYDIVLLGQRFGASFEQVCHRLTTLQRPTARGIPFFMLRLDQAGNVSKRFASGRFQLSRFGGTCPLWNVHATFAAPGKILTDVVELPDGTTYFSIARTVQKAKLPYGAVDPVFAVGLVCELKYAGRLVYARGHGLDASRATPIGVNCRLCERQNCPQRSEPPMTRPIIVDETHRTLSPFAFAE